MSNTSTFARRASDLLVSCLEAEGVRYVFGVPAEETVDSNGSLASSIEYVPRVVIMRPITK